MTYSGKRLLNINNGCFIFLMFFDIAITAKNGPYFGGLFFLIILLITVNEAFYFEVTMDELIVKNYCLPFINIRYNLSEITGVELLSTNYKATADAALQITRDDKTSMPFRSVSLDSKDWQDLVIDLNNRKIPVLVTASRLIDKVGCQNNFLLERRRLR